MIVAFIIAYVYETRHPFINGRFLNMQAYYERKEAREKKAKEASKYIACPHCGSQNDKRLRYCWRCNCKLQ